MPEACNSWQAYACDSNVEYLWHSADLFDRLILVILALLLAYTVFVLERSYSRCYSVCRESRGRPTGPEYTQRSKRKLVADLSCGLGSLRAIALVAPYLGLAGTCDGVIYRLMGLRIAMSLDSAIVMTAGEVAAALVTSAAGTIVALSATLSYNLLTTRIGSLKSELPNTSLLAGDSNGEPIERSRRFAQMLPLQRRFSSVPPYALVAAPILASLVAILTFFQPYAVPTGLWVGLLPIGSIAKHRQSLTPVVVSLFSETRKGTAVVRVNSKPTPLDDLHITLVREQKGASKREVYVEAERTLEWGDVAGVIDIAERVGDGYVILVTTTPDASSGDKRSHK